MGDTADTPPRYRQVGHWKHLVTDEREWLARPAAWGIEKLPEPVRGRKQALYDHHFYPRLAEFLACEVCRPLVVEQFGEDGLQIPPGLPSDRETFRAWYEVGHPSYECDGRQAVRSATLYTVGMITRNEWHNRLIDEVITGFHLNTRSDPSLSGHRAEWQRELALELVGPNPFRPVGFDPEWRTTTTVALARTMYEARDFAPMPVLADALEDAGCTDPAVIGHCRGPGPHVRGCWVVDQVLGLM